MTQAATDIKTKALVYARISSVAQLKKGHGLVSQETRCREFAKMKGYEVEDVFFDKAVSGGTLQRPGIQAMLAHMKAGRREAAYVVLIDDISRLSRDIRVHLDLRDAIAACGGRLESPSIEFGEDSDSILIENLLASVSQHQRQKNAEQTRNRMRARLMNGYWTFIGCMGYRFEKVTGRGKMLVRDEPLASIIQEGLEGYASGRFQLQAEVKRFFESQPAFPKNRRGVVRNQLVTDILTKPLYAGMVEKTDWGVSMRKGQHEGLISFETFQRIQERLTEKAKAPVRANINNDFILRGAVACAECGNPMTACWSTSKTGKKHPYYMCFQKGCSACRKSIRRDDMESAFEALLGQLQPVEQIVSLSKKMFRTMWDSQIAKGEEQRRCLQKQIRDTEEKIENFLDRIVDADNSSVVAAYEKRIAALEKDKLVMVEKLETQGRPRHGFEEMFELAMQFLSNPLALWKTGRLEHRQTVLKLAFAEKLHYCRETGFQTPAIAYPFRVIKEMTMPQGEMAEREGFEPSVRLPAQRFSRPPRSTTPAPLRAFLGAKKKAGSSGPSSPCPLPMGDALQICRPIYPYGLIQAVSEYWSGLKKRKCLSKATLFVFSPYGRPTSARAERQLMR